MSDETRPLAEPVDLDGLRRLCEGISPGPWHTAPDEAWEMGGEWHEFVWNDSEDDNDIVALTGIKGAHCRSATDAAFIAAARTALPALVAEVEVLRALVARGPAGDVR